MNPNQNTEEEIVTSQVNHPVFQVTKTSKYLALLLFILMPFVGGYIGYMYAPEKVVEVERVKNTLGTTEASNETPNSEKQISEVNTIEISGESSPITLTSPNGGSISLDGTPIPITWEPYSTKITGINSLDSVEVYLEKKEQDSFKVIGRIVNGGPESLGTSFNWLGNLDTFLGVPPAEGEYYIRVSNIIEGTEDRSDLPIKISIGAPAVEIEVTPFELLENNTRGDITANYGKGFRIRCETSLPTLLKSVKYELYKDGKLYKTLSTNIPLENTQTFVSCPSYDWQPSKVISTSDVTSEQVFNVQAIITLANGNVIEETSRMFGFYE